MSGAPVFPLRVGAIDMGSNAIRFVVAEFTGPDTWVELESQRLPVRLGHEVFQTGLLDPEAMRATIEAMSFFRRALDTLGVVRYRAVATSAVRESRNGGELVDRIRRECGIHLETITGSEEARLVWVAVRSRVPLNGDRWMIVDLGGGSLEISEVSSEGIHWIESHTMGTVRLLEEFGGSEDEPAAFRALMGEYVNTLRIPDHASGTRLAGLIATGGNAESIAKLAGCEPGERGVGRLPVTRLRSLTAELAGLSVRERMERFGLRRDRADVIVPAGLLYLRVAELAGVDQLLIPNVGVKEGVLIDVADDVAAHGIHVTRLEQQAFEGALALGRRYQFDEPHARHVARLALSLFDQLEPLHGLDGNDRRILAVAAVLHDVGQFISYRRHHKHSLYLIHNSDIPNVSAHERTLVALVARYHRRAEPRPEHFLFADLDDTDRHRVRRLTAILRVADALDREHLQRVTAIRASIARAEVLLEIAGQGELLLEQWALRKKARMFAAEFGLDFSFRVSEAVNVPHNS